MSPAPEWFVTKFQLTELTVRRHEHWTLSLRPAQPTLGACVLSLNRPCEAWGEATRDENAELASVVADTEARLAHCFRYDKLNYLMLMMVDPHVHFHIIPRYGQPREHQGIDWVDRGWPKPPDLTPHDIDASVLEKIRQELASAPGRA